MDELSTNLEKNPRSAKLYKKIQQELGFLFDSGFYLIHCEDGDSFDWCSVVLQGESCQIQFSVDRGFLDCLFGPRDGFNNPHTAIDFRDWFNIYDVVNFTDQNPFEKYKINFIDVEPRAYREDSLGRSLKRFSAALKPRMARISALSVFDNDSNRQLLIDYVANIRRLRNAEDFKKQFSNPTNNNFGSPRSNFSDKSLFKPIIVIFLLLFLIIYYFLFMFAQA
jgi:hypothetical protein